MPIILAGRFQANKDHRPTRMCALCLFSPLYAFVLKEEDYTWVSNSSPPFCFVLPCIPKYGTLLGYKRLLKIGYILFSIGTPAWEVKRQYHMGKVRTILNKMNLKCLAIFIFLLKVDDQTALRVAVSVGEEGGWEQTAWICHTYPVSDQPESLLWWNDCFCEGGENHWWCVPCF